ncbi:MAG: alpha/beta fold hydrolase [Chloroflexota bacterium]
MQIDLELFRRGVIISQQPRRRLWVIDIAPDHPQRTFVFIHGFAGHAGQWVYQLHHFSMQNRAVAFDLPGHGGSDKSTGRFNMDDIVNDIASALEALGINTKIVLVGHSFGGAIATEFAAKYSDRLEALVLTATTGEFKLHPLYRLGLNLPQPLLRLANPFTHQWLHASPVMLKQWYHNILAKWNGWSLFRNLTLPTLVIRGHRDFLFSKTAFDEVARNIPTATEVNVGASGHMVILERRDAVNRAIEQFLSVSPRSWRDKNSHTATYPRTELIRQRPWLSHYEDRVPFTIAVPKVPMQQFLISAVRRFPLRTAILFEGYRLTYRRLNHEVNRFANALRSLGLDKGQRVMLILPNLPQLVIGYFGTLKAGGIAVFTLPITKPDELIRQTNDADARILLILKDFAHLIPDILAQTNLRHVILTDAGTYLPFAKRLAFRFSQRKVQSQLRQLESESNIHRFSRLLYSHQRQSPDVEVLPEDLATIQYTGGTTAAPKGVLLNHRQLVANTIQTRHWIPDAQMGRERFLCVLPFSHSYGLTTGLNVPIALGATLIVKPRFQVKDTLKTIKHYRPTIFPGVPQMYVDISNYPGVRKYGISSIKACISGSAPLPIEVQETFEKLTHGRLVEGYGLTEASPVTHANPLNGLRKVGSIGIPIPSTEAKVVDLTNSRKEVPLGQIGELAVRGPQVMVGYWNDPQATTKTITKDGWLLTGDVVQMDTDGYFRIVARKADMWYPSKPGEPAFPRDVEEVLYEVPQVKEVAVAAIAGAPVAFVIAKDQRPSAEALIAYCKRRLPPELVPCLIIFLDDFPRTFIGKVLRRELARRYAQYHAN